MTKKTKRGACVMKWTTEKPTRDGWYWVRHRGRRLVVNVCHKATRMRYMGEKLRIKDTYPSVRWSDQPIPEPT